MKVEFERQLQTFECMIAWGQEKKGDVTVLPICELSLTRTVNIGVMKSAVNDIVIRHPNLRSVILEQEGAISKEKQFSLCILESSFAVEKFAFFEHIQLKENEEWDFSIAETQMCRSPGVGPDNQQFRVVLVTTSSAVHNDQLTQTKSLVNPETAYLMVFYNHAVGDGMSGYILTNDILTRYTELLGGHEISGTNKKHEIVSTIAELSKKKNSGNVEDSSGKIEIPKGDNVNDLIADLYRRNDTYKQCIPVKTCMNSGMVKNGCICLKGTVDGSATLKAWCKEVKTTIGMAVLAAVYWTLAEFSDEVPILNIDVDLRRRFESSKDEKVLPPQVALLIGMSSVHQVAKVNKEDDFKTYAVRLHNELKRSLADGEHFAFNHAAEQRWFDDSPDYKDMNFSNMGLYSFPTKFDAAGFEIKGYWTPGDGWCPTMFGTMVFLINTVPGTGFCYTMVFEDFEENRQLATRMLEKIRNLCEDPQNASL